MFQEQLKRKILLFLSLIGVLVSILAGLSEYLPVLQSFCANISEGCKDTVTIAVFKLPVWIWGIVFYVVLALCVRQFRQGIVWVVSAGAGAEAAFVWTMITMKAFCIFCIGNLVVFLLIFLVSFERIQIWQTLAIGLFSWVIVFFNLPAEARPSLPYGADQDQPRIVAKVGNEVITSDRLDRLLGSKLLDLEKEIYKLKKDRLDQLIMDEVVQEEANARQMPLEDLVNQVIAPNLSKIDDQEIEKYIQENLDRLKDWTGSFEDLKSRIRTYLEQQERYAEIVKYSKSLEPKYGVTIYLTEPQPLMAKLDLEGSPSVGPADAPVTIVEYSDYQCPACRATHEVVQKLRAMYGDRVRWVFKDYPLKKHKYSQNAAEAARCAGEQGKFWDYQNVLYVSQEELTPEKLEKIAGDLGLSMKEFKQCVESGKYREPIEKDLKEAIRLGVDRTPSFFINGRLVVGGPGFDSFRGMIEALLSKPKREP